MQSARDFRNALVVAFISIGLTIGALSISLVEFVPQAVPSPTNLILPSPAPLTATFTLVPTLTFTAGFESPTPSLTLTFTVTVPPPTSCMPPAGWMQIVIPAGETLDTIAQRYLTSKEALRGGNCLLSDNLVAGSILYVPNVVVASTPTVCSQGAFGWSKSYVVRPGDTLFAISASYYSSVVSIKSVNCKSTDAIAVGEVLWVPNNATRTPTPMPFLSSTFTVIPSVTSTDTVLPYTATTAPTNTPVPDTSTPIPPATATSTSAPIPTATLTPFPPP